jgi:hypothetical protein
MSGGDKAGKQIKNISSAISAVKKKLFIVSGASAVH